MPISGSSSGRAFITSPEPPGRSGASHSSQATQRKISAIRLTLDTICRIFMRSTSQGLRQLQRRFGQPLAQCNAQRALVGAERLVVGGAGPIAGAVGGAAALGVVHF